MRLFKQRIHKFSSLENLQVIQPFANTNVFHWNFELI